MSARTARTVGGLAMLAPLSVDEERRLYGVIRAGREADEQLATTADPAERRRLARARHAGQEAESTLLRATFGLVRARVNERGFRFLNDDLEAAGVEGLVNALRRFDPGQGVRFATYANYWINKLVNVAIQQRVGLTDHDMRLVLKLQKLRRTRAGAPLGDEEIARTLGVSRDKAQEVVHLAREMEARRGRVDVLDDVASAGPPEDAPAWVIDAVKRVTGDDFDAFWQYAFHTMSMDELAREYGISRQGMTKRIERSRRAVRESPEAERLRAWFARQ